MDENLWTTITDLTSQLASNRAACALLQRQMHQLRQQALHTGTGFTLRRFNVDIAQEVFDSELERHNASLVIENQALQSENKALSILLREYENTLDGVMSKFRVQAVSIKDLIYAVASEHSSQQHELAVTKHYETILLSQEEAAQNIALTESLKDQTAVTRLGSLIRSALASLDDLPDTMEEEGMDTIGGYMPKTRPDHALEEETEIQRLSKENDLLRELLRISQLPPETEEQQKELSAAISLGAPRKHMDKSHHSHIDLKDEEIIQLN